MPGFLHISTMDSDMVARSIVQARLSLPLRCHLSPVFVSLKLEVKKERKEKA
jgi:hypothetical protein